jgi:hypothetical protein
MGEAEVEVELDKLGSVQLQLQLQRQGIVPFGAMKPTDWLHLFGALEAYGSASCSPLAIWSFNFLFGDFELRDWIQFSPLW